MSSPSCPSSLEAPGYALLALRAPVLAELPWLIHGFSTRLGGVSSLRKAPLPDGDLNLGRTEWDALSHVRENRRRFLNCLGARRMKLVLQNQIHSDLIRVVDQFPEATDAGLTLRGDGLATGQPGLLLSILSADCLPVLVADIRQRVIAALHCGWRGTARRLAQKAVGLLRLRFGSRPEDLRAAIGPGIRDCCFEVGEEVAEEFASQFLYAPQILRLRQKHQTNLERKYALLFRSPFRPMPVRSGRSFQVDLVEANVRQLQEAGLSRRSIGADLPCTSCHPELFFSHRRDAGRTGRMIGGIGIRPERL